MLKSRCDLETTCLVGGRDDLKALSFGSRLKGNTLTLGGRETRFYFFGKSYLSVQRSSLVTRTTIVTIEDSPKASIWKYLSKSKSYLADSIKRLAEKP